MSLDFTPSVGTKPSVNKGEDISSNLKPCSLSTSTIISCSDFDLPSTSNTLFVDVVSHSLKYFTNALLPTPCK